MSKIVYDYIEEYIRGLLPSNDELLKEMETFAHENHVPIIQPEVAKFLSFIIKSKMAKDILEVGTAIGYSAICMCKAAGDCNVTSIERDAGMTEKALDYISKAGLKDKISVIEGEAQSVLSLMDRKFDLIFLDAAKGQYLEFFNDCHRMLRTGGILFADNVLFRGMVASNELLIRRKITIVKRLRKYLEFIQENSNYETSILPLGDGVMVSVKLGR